MIVEFHPLSARFIIFPANQIHRPKTLLTKIAKGNDSFISKAAFAFCRPYLSDKQIGDSADLFFGEM